MIGRGAVDGLGEVLTVREAMEVAADVGDGGVLLLEVLLSLSGRSIA